MFQSDLNFPSRNVVAQTQRARFFASHPRRDCPVEGVCLTIAGNVSEVIITRQGTHFAAGRRETPRLLFFPHAIFVSACLGVVREITVALAVARSAFAVALVLHVLRLGFVKRAAREAGHNDSNILPGRWMPVRVVLALFGALKAVTCCTGVLAGIAGIVSVYVLVSDPEALVPLSVLARLVVLERLVAAVPVVILGIGVIGNCCSRPTINIVTLVVIDGRAVAGSARSVASPSCRSRPLKYPRTPPEERHRSVSCRSLRKHADLSTQ